ncbi:Plant cysteine oxidase 2 [Linum perenne]
MLTPLQKLFDTCKEVFKFGGAGIVPSPDNVQKLRAVLGNAFFFTWIRIVVHLLGNHAKLIGVKPPIRYLHLHECNKFSIGIFCLPPSAVLPLHNHPGMTVFSKLLFGTMHIKSYDWVADVHATLPVGLDTTQVQSPKVRLAKVKANSNFTAPCDTSILYPAEGGNMHCFTAVTACAVLDVLGPPYNDAEGRHCQYYFDFPSSAFPGTPLVLFLLL